MKKWIPGIAGAIIVVLALISIVSRNSQKPKNVAKVAKEQLEAQLNAANEEVRAALAKEGTKSVATSKKGESAASSDDLKNSLASLITQGVANTNEVSIPLTVKLAREGKSWKLSGIELAGETAVAQKPAQPVVVAAALASKDAEISKKIEALEKKESAPKSAINQSAFAVYFLANSSVVGPMGTEVIKAVAEKAKSDSVKRLVLRGYSELALTNPAGKSVAQMRAESVKQELEKAGVSAAKLQIEKVGPSPDGLTPKQKRRVEIVLE